MTQQESRQQPVRRETTARRTSAWTEPGPGSGQQPVRHETSAPTRPAKVQTGTFRFATGAFINGVIVREDPVKRYSRQGTPWTEATLLVDLYDGRQRAERERPAFVRVKAFGELADELAALRNRNRLHVAGPLLLDIWEGRDGNVRESWEIHADALSRQPFPRLDKLFADQTRQRDGDARRDGPADYDDSQPFDEKPEDGGEPWAAESGTPRELTEDDIPF